jgi:hypothetical protein
MKWLFLLHQVQTPNSRERVKVWRLTKKVGTLLYRNSVYVLPYSKERLEDFHWLCQEIKDAKGDASVFISEANDDKEDRVLRQMFVAAREREYADLEVKLDKHLDRFRRAISTEVFSAAHLKALEKNLRQLETSFRDIRRVDFFIHPMGTKIDKRLKAARLSLAGIEQRKEASSVIKRRTRSDFKGKVWATREHIHIDRLCSAWLIQRFIDPRARFVFASENDLPKNAIPFDVFGAEFSHHGDRCTFETLLEAFRIKDKALASLGELVHNIDLKDQKYNRPEGEGLDMIVRGISDSLHDDHKTLTLGAQVLDALYDRLSSNDK